VALPASSRRALCCCIRAAVAPVSRDRSISPARWAHSSKPAAETLLRDAVIVELKHQHYKLSDACSIEQ